MVGAPSPEVNTLFTFAHHRCTLASALVVRATFNYDSKGLLLMAFYHFAPNVQSYADLYLDTLNGTIRAGDPLAALRVLQYSPPTDPPTPHFFYHLGPSGWHDARAIVQGVMVDNFHAEALTAPELPPAPEESLTDAVWESLSQCLTSKEEFKVVFGLLNGGELESYINLIGGRDNYTDLKERLAHCGLHIRSAKFALQLKQDLKPTPITPQFQLRPPQPVLSTVVTTTTPKVTIANTLSAFLPPEAIPTDGHAIGPVMPCPPEILARLEAARAKRKASSTATGRIRWPFKGMKVGDHVVIRGELAKRAGNAAHVYAARRKWALSVLKDGSGGIIIVRQPDPSPL